MSEPRSPFPWAKCLLVVIPSWLLISGGVGLYLHFQSQKKAQEETPHAYRKNINARSIADDYQKITEVIKARHHQSEQGIQGLKRMAAMIEGALGPSNIGYEVHSIPGVEVAGQTLPLISVDVMKKHTPEETWLLIPYDSDPTLPRGAETASSVAVGLALAQQMIGQTWKKNCRFLFFPGAYLDEEPRIALLAKMQRLISHDEQAGQVLVLGSMLHPGQLHLLCRDSELPIAKIPTPILGAPESGESCLNDDGETSTLLYEMGLSAALLYSKSDEEYEPNILDTTKVPAEILVTHAESIITVLKELDQQAQKK